MAAEQPYPTSTDRIRLRRLEAEDVELLNQLNHDEGVLQYLFRRPPPLEQITNSVNNIIEGYSHQPALGRWIAETEAGEFMGWFMLDPYTGDQRGELSKSEDPLSVLEVGYRLRPQVWGKGFATEGCRKLISHAFSLQGVDYVIAVAMFNNKGSRRVMEKCGLKYIKTFHMEFDEPLPGTELGEVLYSISRKEFQDEYGFESINQ